jgi:hypothetical protein
VIRENSTLPMVCQIPRRNDKIISMDSAKDESTCIPGDPVRVPNALILGFTKEKRGG